jgi:hypothetical protein
VINRLRKGLRIGEVDSEDPNIRVLIDLVIYLNSFVQRLAQAISNPPTLVLIIRAGRLMPVIHSLGETGHRITLAAFPDTGVRQVLCAYCFMFMRTRGRCQNSKINRLVCIQKQ